MENNRPETLSRHNNAIKKNPGKKQSSKQFYQDNKGMLPKMNWNWYRELPEEEQNKRKSIPDITACLKTDKNERVHERMHEGMWGKKGTLCCVRC